MSKRKGEHFRLALSCVRPEREKDRERGEGRGSIRLLVLFIRTRVQARAGEGSVKEVGGLYFLPNHLRQPLDDKNNDPEAFKQQNQLFGTFGQQLQSTQRPSNIEIAVWRIVGQQIHSLERLGQQRRRPGCLGQWRRRPEQLGQRRRRPERLGQRSSSLGMPWTAAWSLQRSLDSNPELGLER
ncbi:hypothetical protein MA16_Dca027186 [Dendrobium catenatum]|uniref:Uncharacterized protein n=1 Tax=Dendrobium catenatum TaxID=906689 RepID=A0A2I0VEX3_9ASPA|nr:hypothetical protein MA16_Dca027186 [Dendrobium catenatum]